MMKLRTVYNWKGQAEILLGSRCRGVARMLPPVSSGGAPRVMMMVDRGENQRRDDKRVV